MKGSGGIPVEQLRFSQNLAASFESELRNEVFEQIAVRKNGFFEQRSEQLEYLISDQNERKSRGEESKRDAIDSEGIWVWGSFSLASFSPFRLGLSFSKSSARIGMDSRVGLLILMKSF